MKINKHIVNQKVADTVDAGLSVVPIFAQKPSALAAAIRRAIYSSPFMLPVFVCTLPGMVFANPEGGQVVAGSATISNPDADTTLISQSSAQTVIDWQRFNIGSQEYVQFVQPDSSSVALNRVIGGNPSEILGNLSANGQVFLVNPNGIYFGQHAMVDVGGIVASVLDISTDDFMAGNYVFSEAAGAPSDVGVVNDGVITARDGGYVVLMGDYAHNNGIVSARMGTVALAAGNRVTMDVKGNGLVSVAIEEETFSSLAGVNNTGEIMAAGGRVIMSAKVANDLIDTAINNEGLVVANSIAERNGVIFLTAAGGDIVNSGTLDASAEDGSNVDGGGVLIYSDRNVTLSSNAAVSARGDGSGTGGTVRVIAEDFMDHQSGARIDVTSEAGDGGFVELSGHGSLAIRGDVNIGTGGELLIDPGTLTITNSNNTPGFTTGGSPTPSNGFVGKGFVEGQLNANTNVTLVANNNILAAGGTLGAAPTFSINATTGSGNLTILNGTVGTGGTLGGTGTLGCTMTGVCLPGAGSNSVTQGATGNISLGTVSININGSLNVAGGSTAGSVSIGAINAGGNVLITAGTNVNILGNVAGAGTSFKASAGSNISINGGMGTGSLLNAKVTLNAGNNVNINSNIFLANNALNFNADSDVTGAGDVNIYGIAAQSLTVSTRGALNVSGQNFNVVGATSAGFGTSATSQVFVKADDNNAATTTDNITVAVAGNMNVTGGTGQAFIGDGGQLLADVSANVSAGNDITINAGSLNIKGGNASGGMSFGTGSITARANATVTAGGNLTATLGGNLNVSGGSASASGSGGTLNINANADAALVAGGTLKVAAAGSILLSSGAVASTVSPPVTAILSAGATVSAGALNMMASGNITGNGADISAAGLYMAAANNIDLLTSNVTVAGGTVAGISGDAMALSFLRSVGIAPPTTPDPNAKFSAGGTLDLGTITMTGDIPYLWLEADVTNIGGLTLPDASDVLVQFSPFTPTASIGVEALPDSSQLVNYNNLEHFDILTGTTIIIGSSSQTGELVIGSLSDIDIGSKNMVVVTSSSVTSISNVISTGIVAELLIGQASFIAPIQTEVDLSLKPVEDADDEKEKKKNLVKDDEEDINMCEVS
ncbi:MAG: filamentous hemagglutinin N-terminal domain-containing protein [Gammaproteobacteria bacterium]|nr:filamentous hemagglutinin N-terminal domain-containing protein [Gammaproteobacteria bacterium]